MLQRGIIRLPFIAASWPPLMSFPTPHDPDPVSPCVGVCAVNPATQLCDGCFRTLAEIEQWWDYTPAQKQTVLAEIEERLARIMDGTFFD